MKKPDKTERYLKITQFLENALVLCGSSGVTKGSSVGTIEHLEPNEERKYALVLLYLGNFFMRLAIWEETDPRARVPYSFPERRATSLSDSPAQRQLFSTFDRVREHIWEELKARRIQTRETGLVQKFFTCNNCLSEKHSFDNVQDLLILAEMCFLVSDDILKNFIYIFDKAFLSNRQGLLYYKLAISAACRPTRSQTTDCATLKLYIKALALFDSAANTYAAHQREDPENMWAFADTCVDRANLCFQMHKFRLRSLAVHGSKSKAATSVFEYLLAAERLADLHHQLSTFLSTNDYLEELESKYGEADSSAPKILIEWLRQDTNKMRAKGWSPEKLFLTHKARIDTELTKLEELKSQSENLRTEAAQAGQDVERVRAENAIETVDKDILILLQVGAKTKRCLEMTTEVELDMQAVYEEVLKQAEAYQYLMDVLNQEDDDEKQHIDAKEHLLSAGLGDDLARADRFYIDALKMYSTEHDYYRKNYPLNPRLYYFRDDFDDSGEHWKQAVHYKKRRRKDKASVVPVPSRIAIKRVRNYIYSNRPIFSRRILAQAFSATGSDNRSTSGTIYFEKFIGTPKKVDEDKNEDPKKTTV